jgi:hypothetical protein
VVPVARTAAIKADAAHVSTIFMALPFLSTSSTICEPIIGEDGLRRNPDLSAHAPHLIAYPNQPDQSKGSPPTRAGSATPGERHDQMETSAGARADVCCADFARAD